MSYLKQFAKTLRGSLSTSPAGPSGTPGSFTLPLRKLVLRYNQLNPSSAGTRSFLLSQRFSELTKAYPSVEFVVSEAGREKHPLVTGLYASANGNQWAQGASERRKDINLANLDANQVEAKVKLVIEASGKKVKSLKRRPVESKAESARGVWSQIHAREVDI